MRSIAMNLLRLTIVDPNGAISFVTHGEALPALMRSCASNPKTMYDLLERAEAYYVGLMERIANGLVMFDERNTKDNYSFIHRALEIVPGDETPVFRVVDDQTREASLRPVQAGCVVINLTARRVITLQNGYIAITRNGRGEVFDGERLTGATFVYRLPQAWSLVP
jgi:hypothetical protein